MYCGLNSYLDERALSRNVKGPDLIIKLFNIYFIYKLKYSIDSTLCYFEMADLNIIIILYLSYLINCITLLFLI